MFAYLIFISQVYLKTCIGQYLHTFITCCQSLMHFLHSSYRTPAWYPRNIKTLICVFHSTVIPDFAIFLAMITQDSFR